MLDEPRKFFFVCLREVIFQKKCKNCAATTFHRHFLDIKRKMQQYFDMAVVNIYFTTMVVAAIIVNDQITHFKNLGE